MDANDRVLLIDVENTVGPNRPRPALVRARVTALRAAAGTVHHTVACYSAADPSADVVVSVLAEHGVAPWPVPPAPDAAEAALLHTPATSTRAVCLGRRPRPRQHPPCSPPRSATQPPTNESTSPSRVTWSPLNWCTCTTGLSSSPRALNPMRLFEAPSNAMVRSRSLMLWRVVLPASIVRSSALAASYA